MTMNRPTAGSRFDKTLPVGNHPIQLYSLATPNGQKVTILLEELIEANHPAEYDAWPIRIMEEDQFGSEFVDINPNSKIPAMRVMDSEGKEPLNIFESGSILLYLAEKYKAFLPEDASKRVETLNWLFWQVGSGPYVGGGFGHFYQYADVKLKYPIERFTMETKRQLHVLELHLKTNKYMVGNDYTIAGTYGTRTRLVFIMYIYTVFPVYCFLTLFLIVVCRHGHLALVRQSGAGRFVFRCTHLFEC